jgi:aryl-alcohol dehydrogenase-like predicted oxidoreductase
VTITDSRPLTPAAAVLGIGTATFLAQYGLAASVPATDTLLARALECGLTYLDTAADYADAEAAVGRVLRHGTRGVRVCTKIPASAGLEAVRRSVERLGWAPDTILMHSAGREQIVGAPAIAALREAKARGMTARIGASTYGAADAALALAQPWCDVVQAEYSVLNQSVVRAVTRARDGQEIVVRSVLCKGLLTSRRSAAPHLAAAVAEAVDGIERCAREWNRRIEELAIRFALDTPGIDVVLVGVSTEAELDAAMAAASSARLTGEQWQRLAAFDRSDADAVHPERWAQRS